MNATIGTMEPLTHPPEVLLLQQLSVGLVPACWQLLLAKLSLSWEENVLVLLPNFSKLMENMSKEIACKDFNAMLQIMRSKSILMLAFNSQKFLVLLCSKTWKQLNLLQSYYLGFWDFSPQG